MNADGFLLLDRLETAEPDEKRILARKIDRIACYARTKKHVELIEWRKLLNTDKMTAEFASAQLLARLLETLT